MAVKATEMDLFQGMGNKAYQMSKFWMSSIFNNR